MCVSPARVTYTLALSVIGRSCVDLNRISTGLSDREWGHFAPYPVRPVHRGTSVGQDRWGSSGLPVCDFSHGTSWHNGRKRSKKGGVAWRRGCHQACPAGHELPPAVPTDRSTAFAHRAAVTTLITGQDRRGTRLRPGRGRRWSRHDQTHSAGKAKAPGEIRHRVRLGIYARDTITSDS